MNRTLLLAMALTVPPIAAQNSDLSFLFGVASNRVELSRSFVRTENRANFQVNYAWQFREGPRGRFYVELPLLLGGGTSSLVGPAVFGTAGGIVFLTPGLRYHLNVTPRLALYGATGLGFASKVENLGFTSGNNRMAWTRWSVGLAGNVGGGLDFRLSRLWSLRGEVRNYLTNRSTSIGSRNYLTAQFGFALHF